MNPITDTDYKQLFSQLIKKQMLVLGPDITLAKVRNVTGLTVDINGDVQKIEGDPQALLQGLINQFVELSGMIVKKTMESILTSYPGMMAMAATGAFGSGVDVTAQTQPAVTQQAVSQPQEPTVHEPAKADTVHNDQTAVSSPSADGVAFPPQEEKHAEPPSMTDIKLDSLNAPIEKPKESSFSQDEMAKLNKALEELSNAPSTADQTPVK